MTRIKFCEQCDKLFWGERSTARFCSPTCRKRHSRGTPTESYWHATGTLKAEEIAAKVAEQHPKTWRKLEAIRDKYGNRALYDVLDVIEQIIRD